MGVVLGLIAAVCYGASDFAAGLGSRRTDPAAVAILSQPFGLVAAAIALVVVGGDAPTTESLLWGAAGGVAIGIAVIAFYRALTVGRMNVVAPLSAVLTAALPAVVGLATGDHVDVIGAVGLIVAAPALWLVSRADDEPERPASAGIVESAIAGLGFGVFFIAMSQAGTAAGAWPLIPAELAALAVVLALGLAVGHPAGHWRASLWPAALTGVLGGLANLAYLAATGKGELTLVAVVTALYPATTVLLARAVLKERWNNAQASGLVLAMVSVACITLGG